MHFEIAKSFSCVRIFSGICKDSSRIRIIGVGLNNEYNDSKNIEEVTNDLV